MPKQFNPKITVFYCFNIFKEKKCFPDIDLECNIEKIQLPCSSLVRDIYLLKAFEAGADAVVVLVCPEGSCRYVEGNIRAKKRVNWVKNLLDEAGINGQRLKLFNVRHRDAETTVEILKNVIEELNSLGPNPAGCKKG